MPKSQRNRKLGCLKDRNKEPKKVSIANKNAPLVERNGKKQAVTIPKQKGKIRRTKGMECQVLIDV